jgi:hypothetical protein
MMTSSASMLSPRRLWGLKKWVIPEAKMAATEDDSPIQVLTICLDPRPALVPIMVHAENDVVMLPCPPGRLSDLGQQRRPHWRKAIIPSTFNQTTPWDWSP